MNKKGQTGFFLAVGILGALVILYGGIKPLSDLVYLVACSLMLVCAIYFKLTYFIALEMILISGHGAVLLGLGTLSQVIIPILLCLQLLVYYLLSGQLGNVFRVIGITGIALVTVGFSYEHQQEWFFLFGGLGVATFAFYQVYRGRFAAWIWAILNSLLVCISLFKLVF